MQAAYPHCAERLFGRAHAIEPRALRALIEGPAGRRILRGERPDHGEDLTAASRKKRLSMVAADPVSVANGCGEYALTSDGVAIVQVSGVLSQRFDWLSALCGWTTYEGLAATFAAMLGDYRVNAILMDVDSPGGEAAGMLDVADMILAARSRGPVWAVANTFAASAAYAIAASAEQLFVPRLAEVGSIGAVCVHVDMSQADEAMGERYTAVYSGARKIDGWQHAPLSDGAQTVMQHGVDHCRDQFAQLVARQGRLSAAAAIATEASMLHDAEAVTAKLADRVGSFDEALSELSDLVTRSSRGGFNVSAMRAKSGDIDMPKKTPAADAAIAEDPSPAAAVEDPAVVAAAAAAAAELAPIGAAAETADVCPECGRSIVPDEDDDEEAKHFAAAIETLDLCILGGASLQQAREFVTAKTPHAEVREKLTASRAKQGEEVALVATASPAAKSSAWEGVADSVSKQFGLKPKS